MSDQAQSRNLEGDARTSSSPKDGMSSHVKQMPPCHQDDAHHPAALGPRPRSPPMSIPLSYDGRIARSDSRLDIPNCVVCTAHTNDVNANIRKCSHLQTINSCMNAISCSRTHGTLSEGAPCRSRDCLLNDRHYDPLRPAPHRTDVACYEPEKGPLTDDCVASVFTNSHRSNNQVSLRSHCGDDFGTQQYTSGRSPLDLGNNLSDVNIHEWPRRVSISDIPASNYTRERSSPQGPEGSYRTDLDIKENQHVPVLTDDAARSQPVDTLAESILPSEARIENIRSVVDPLEQASREFKPQIHRGSFPVLGDWLVEHPNTHLDSTSTLRIGNAIEAHDECSSTWSSDSESVVPESHAQSNRTVVTLSARVLFHAYRAWMRKATHDATLNGNDTCTPSVSHPGQGDGENNKRKASISSNSHDDESIGKKRKHGMSGDGTACFDNLRALGCPFNKYDDYLFGYNSPDPLYHGCSTSCFAHVDHLK